MKGSNSVAQLNLEKEISTRLYSQKLKPGTKGDQRNPIVHSELEPALQNKPSKVMVPNYMESARQAEMRPRGKGRAEYSNKGWGSRVFGEATNEFKPSRKVIEQAPSEVAQPKISRKKALATPETRDPINQPGLEFQLASPRPRGLGAQKSTIDSVLKYQEYPQEHLTPKPRPNLEKNNKSKVFETTPVYEPFKPARKKALERDSGTDSILKYNYALPYRETGNYSKPNESNLDPRGYAQVKSDRKASEVYKLRRNQSSVTFI